MLALLSSLNSNIIQIRAEYEADKKNGTAFAAEILSKTVGNGRTPKSVKDKIRQLWKVAGPSDGLPSESVDMIYLTGAWTWTLPSLGADELYPGLLDELKVASHELAQGR